MYDALNRLGINKGSFLYGGSTGSFTTARPIDAFIEPRNFGSFSPITDKAEQEGYKMYGFRKGAFAQPELGSFKSSFPGEGISRGIDMFMTKDNYGEFLPSDGEGVPTEVIHDILKSWGMGNAADKPAAQRAFYQAMRKGIRAMKDKYKTHGLAFGSLLHGDGERFEPRFLSPEVFEFGSLTQRTEEPQSTGEEEPASNPFIARKAESLVGKTGFEYQKRLEAPQLDDVTRQLYDSLAQKEAETQRLSEEEARKQSQTRLEAFLKGSPTKAYEKLRGVAESGAVDVIPDDALLGGIDDSDGKNDFGSILGMAATPTQFNEELLGSRDKVVSKLYSSIKQYEDAAKKLQQVAPKVMDGASERGQSLMRRDMKYLREFSTIARSVLEDFDLLSGARSYYKTGKDSNSTKLRPSATKEVTKADLHDARQAEMGDNIRKGMKATVAKEQRDTVPKQDPAPTQSAPIHTPASTPVQPSGKRGSRFSYYDTVVPPTSTSDYPWYGRLGNVEYMSTYPDPEPEPIEDGPISRDFGNVHLQTTY